jgi:hypothetical protein
MAPTHEAIKDHMKSPPRALAAQLNSQPNRVEKRNISDFMA